MSAPSPVTPVIGYATPVQAIRNAWLLLVARLAGVLPLVVGVGTTILFVVVPQPVLMMIGIWTIILGTLLVGVGFVCLLIYYFTNGQKDPVLRRRVNRQSGWALLLLVANFPAAYVCMMVAVKMAKRDSN